jgi:hypothetical protein
MSTRVILFVLCVILLSYVAGSAAVYANRRDWPRLRRFLFSSRRPSSIYSGPLIIWAAIAAGALVRLFV